MNKIQVFVSSKYSEFEMERALVKHEIDSFPFLESILAEDWSPRTGRSEDFYIADVNRSHIYIGLFGSVYSKPTHVEYEAACGNPHRERLIYLRDCPPGKRDPELRGLIADILDQHVVRKYAKPVDLLPVLQSDLQAALWRIVDLCKRLGDSADSRIGPTTRDLRIPQSLRALELPADPQAASALAMTIERALISRRPIG